MVFLGNAIDLVEDISQQNKIGFFFVVQVLTIFLSIGGLYLLIKLLIQSYRQKLYSNRLNHKTKQTEIKLEQSLLLGQSHLNLVDFNEHFKISKLQGSQVASHNLQVAL